MLYYLGPKVIVDELLKNETAAVQYQATVYLALPDAEQAALKKQYVLSIYVGGMGFKEVDLEIYGVDAPHTDAKCLGDGCNEYRMEKPAKLVSLKKEGT